MFKKFLKKHKTDLVFLLIISFSLPIIIYKLGQSSLTSFDEAWYADIARNIVRNKDPINLTFNGRVYNDHPPFGFWLILLGQLVLGFNEIGSRIAPAMAGMFSLYILYFLGKELFSREVGLVSSLALVSSPWFLFRARSGNLDTILTLFFILTIFLAIKAAKNKIYIWPFSISLLLLLLTKTAIPFTIIPALLVIFYNGKKVKINNLLVPMLLTVLVFAAWFYYQTTQDLRFVNHYFKIGLPGVSKSTTVIENIQLMKQYLHSGIGRWFWPGILGLVLGIFTLQRRMLILIIFFISFFTPFILSNKGHIWHLVPLHPFMILAFFGLMYLISKQGLNVLRLMVKKFTKFELTALHKKAEILVSIALLTTFLYISYPQFKRNWYEFIEIDAFVSDEAILSKKAGEYTQNLYIDGDFVPSAVFYSEKNVQQMWSDGLPALFGNEESFLLITYHWRLDTNDISENDYEILEKDRDKLLIIRR